MACCWRQERWQSCYQHVMVQLKYLLNPGSIDGSNTAVQRVQHLGADGQQAFRKVLLQVVLSTAFLILRPELCLLISSISSFYFRLWRTAAVWLQTCILHRLKPLLHRKPCVVCCACLQCSQRRQMLAEMPAA